jgi:predicted nucleotidyltransferase
VIGLAAILRATAARLDANGLKWAVVGGLAVSARTSPRFTQDIDLAVVVSSDVEAERLVGNLARDAFRITAVVEQTATGRLATARLSRSGADPDDAVLDLLFASSGIESEVVGAAEPVELFPGLNVPIAQIGHLIAMKVLARDDETRPQDLVDLRALLVEASASDLATARDSLTLITERGYHRDRDLQAHFNALLSRFRPGS